MWKITLKGLLAHKLRLALTATAIVLGVTFISGTFVLTDTLHNTFTTLFGNVYQNIDFQVRGVAQFSDNSGGAVRNPISESILPEVVQVPGVEAAAGTVRATPSSSRMTGRRSPAVGPRPSGSPSTPIRGSRSFTSWRVWHRPPLTMS